MILTNKRKETDTSSPENRKRHGIGMEDLKGGLYPGVDAERLLEVERKNLGIL